MACGCNVAWSTRPLGVKNISSHAYKIGSAGSFSGFLLKFPTNIPVHLMWEFPRVNIRYWILNFIPWLHDWLKSDLSWLDEEVEGRISVTQVDKWLISLWSYRRITRLSESVRKFQEGRSQIVRVKTVAKKSLKERFFCVNAIASVSFRAGTIRPNVLSL